jgi:hypothetical protein
MAARYCKIAQIEEIPWIDEMDDLMQRPRPQALAPAPHRKRPAAEMVWCELWPSNLRWIAFDPPWLDSMDPRPARILWVLPHPIVVYGA